MEAMEAAMNQAPSHAGTGACGATRHMRMVIDGRAP